MATCDLVAVMVTAPGSGQGIQTWSGQQWNLASVSQNRMEEV